MTTSRERMGRWLYFAFELLLQNGIRLDGVVGWFLAPERLEPAM